MPLFKTPLRNSLQAAEAMGAISDPSSIPILKAFLTDPSRSVRETCEIAISKIDWDNSEEGRQHHTRLSDQCSLPAFVSFRLCQLSSIPYVFCSSRFTSVDPAPATSGLLRGPPKAENISQQSIESLQEHLVDISLPLFDRYRAMFALRNIGTKAAVDALASGFKDDSELFKYIHLIIYFLILSFLITGTK